MKLRILCLPLSSPGHLNPVLGFTTVLQKRGHEVIFALDQPSAGCVAKYGFKEEIYEDKENVCHENVSDSNKRWMFIVDIMMKSFCQERVEAINCMAEIYKEVLATQKRLLATEALETILNKTQPDLILYDTLIWSPAIINSRIPVVQLVPGNPLLVLEDDNLSPAFSGLPLDSNRDNWQAFRDQRQKIMKDLRKELENLLISQNVKPPSHSSLLHTSSALNIYIYPKSLAADYVKRSSISKYWTGVDHALRPSDRIFSLPEELLNMPGKLVYFSLGSLGSSDVDLMKTMIAMLEKAAPEYKFIVSKGMRHEEFELAKNMWGQRHIPQLGVLPLVDLVIIHGGNNSFIETLYFAKPLILIPLMCDQFDNAQRARELNLGATFNPFKQSGQDLIQLMANVINNEDYIANVNAISKELKESESMEEAAIAIENIVRNSQ